MLAREVVETREAAIEFVERGRIEVEVRAHAFEQRRRFVQLDRGGVEHRVDLGQPRFVLGLAREFVAHLLQLAAERRAVFAAQAHGRGIARAYQAGRMRVAAMRGDEIGERGRIDRIALEFLQLVSEEGHAVGGVAALRQRLAFAHERGPAARGRLHVPQHPVVAAEGIEQRELAPARHQRLVFVLPVDFDEAAGEFGQLRDGGGAAVDPGLRTAVGAQRAAQLAGVAVVVEFHLAQPRGGIGRVAQVEHRDQFRPFSPVAHDAAVRARTGQEAERVDQQRLAGAGFAGDHGQSRAEIQFGGADDREVLDRKMGEHGH